MSSWEEWGPVIGFEGLYEVSSLGRVRSLPRETCKGIRGGVVLKAGVAKSGYRRVSLCSGDKRQMYRWVHDLVCTSFNGPRPEGRIQCRHYDGDKLNNLATNLCWGTATENMSDMIRHGRSRRGTRNPNATINEEVVRGIRFELFLGTKQVEIARMYSVSQMTVSNIKLRKRWEWVKP